MPRFVIEPHFRLQEWVAEEKGYFAQEGLDYVFRELVQSTDGAIHNKGDKVGAYQSFEAGREADVSCACHWTVGVAASVVRIDDVTTLSARDAAAAGCLDSSDIPFAGCSGT